MTMSFVAAAANAAITQPTQQARAQSTSAAPALSTSTPKVPDFAVLSPLVTRILGLNPGKFTLQGTNTYLVGSGKRRVLIDTGEGRQDYLETLEKYASVLGFEIEAVLITHWHGDHVGGVQQILDSASLRSSGAEKNQQPTVYKYRLDDEASLTPVEPQPHWETSRTGRNNRHGWSFIGLEDGETLEFDGFSLTAYHTPGHAADHMVYWLSGEEESAMFSGDNVLGEGSTVFEDLAEYLSSLERMANVLDRAGKQSSRKQVRVYPGHGHLLEDGHSKVQEYIRHRKQREDEIVASLRKHHGKSLEEEAEKVVTVSVTEIVEDMYAEYPSSLHAAAARGVGLHLDKLHRDGRVERIHGKWRLHRHELQSEEQAFKL